MDAMSGLYEIEVETIESGICLETIDTESTRELKVFIPKLMPLSQVEEPKKEQFFINRSVLLNDTTSIPQNIQYSLILTNYITIPLSAGSFYKTTISKGQRVFIMIPNKNILDMRVISI